LGRNPCGDCDILPETGTVETWKCRFNLVQGKSLGDQRRINEMLLRLKTISSAAALSCLFAFSGQRAYADLVTFDNLTGPSTFAAAGAEQTLVYPFLDTTATFSGGVVLTNETSQTTDNTSVYATCAAALCGGSATLLNPLTVTFSVAIQNFSIQILNALAGSYTMSDNVGDSVTFSLATTGGSIATEGFAAAGTQVTITYNTAPTAWDFAIDNVTFDQALPNSTPEPASFGMVGLGLAIAGFAWRKNSRRRNAA
jgi:hypothetical protein